VAGPQDALFKSTSYLTLPLPPYGPGQSPGRKLILTNLRVSKRTSWQHLSAFPEHFLWRKMRYSPYI